MEHVILVDPQDNAIGTMEKMEAHRKGLLHRAFSVMVYHSNGDILLQKRARTKYHSGGLWTNACCSHPLPDETMDNATRRKLNQEMGIDLKTIFAYKFIYRTNLDHGLIEHECDHVFTGVFDGEPVVNRNEVEDWKFISPCQLLADVQMNPQNYTHWFKLILNQPPYAAKN
ncbi:MAG TPA: isopentenyl-diphosphate Delta-isomerase [Cyclobacteriaceae bacterium]|nr:isopentenyl-diphosphate Delta-isomerase [Cyclobacteriaceae bacterium]